MKPTRLIGLAAIILCAVAGVSPALAQELGDSPSDENDQEAKRIFHEGDAHYAAGRYEKAVELFTRAYELSQRPQLLFNLANAQERLGNYAEAAASLRLYVNSPNAADVSSVNERIERLELNAVEQKKKAEETARLEQALREKAAVTEEKAAPREAPTPSPIIERSPQADDEDRVGPSRVPGALVVGLGVALIGGGAVAGLVSSRAGSDAEGKCSDSGLCPLSAQADLDRQKKFALISDVSVGAGLVAIGAGAYLLLRGRSAVRGSGDVAIGVSPEQAGWAVSMIGSF